MVPSFHRVGPGSRKGDVSDGRIRLDPPGSREFVLDKANLLDPAVKAKTQEECGKLLTDKATPIIVVTIPSMAEYGGANLRIETFARLLFDQWQIGIAQLNKENWNTGILLLVSSGDRQARIELGAGWRHNNDQICQQIMGQQIIPYFKQGDYAGGITAGVKALDAMARGKALADRPAAVVALCRDRGHHRDVGLYSRIACAPRVERLGMAALGRRILSDRLLVVHSVDVAFVE